MEDGNQDTYRGHMRQRLRTDEPKGYLDYLLEQVDQDTSIGGPGSGFKSPDPNAPNYSPRADALNELVAMFAQSGRGTPSTANYSWRRPTRNGSGVRLEGHPALPMQGLFGGGQPQPLTQDEFDRYLPVPLRGPGPNAPVPRQNEDGSWQVPGSQNDPILKMLQDWINRIRPNGD